MSDFEDFEDENAEEKIEEALKSTNLVTRSDAIIEKARRMWFRRNIPEAINLMESGAEIREQLKDSLGASQAYMDVGFLHTHEKRHEQALSAYKLCVQHAREALNSEWEIHGLVECAKASRKLRRIDDSIAFYKEALAQAETFGYERMASLKASYARVLRQNGFAQEAEPLLVDAAEIAITNGNDHIVPRADNELANALAAEGNHREAFEKAKTAFHLAEYNEDVREMDKARFLMALSKNKMSEFAEALKIIEEMKANVDFRKSTKHKVRTDLQHTIALAGLNRNPEALKLVDRVIYGAKHHKLLEVEGEATAIQARLQYFAANTLDSQQTAAAALELAKSNGAQELELDMRYLLSACFSANGMLDQMVEVLVEITGDETNTELPQYWFAAGDLALHYATAGNAEAAQTYTALIKASKSPFINDAVQAQSLEAQAILFDAAGEKVKAKNARAKAMQTYLIAGNTERATILANLLK